MKPLTLQRGAVLAVSLILPALGVPHEQGNPARAQDDGAPAAAGQQPVVPIIVLKNATTHKIVYRIPDAEHPDGGERYRIDPDWYHLYRDRRKMTIGYGFGFQPVTLSAGRLYEMRRDADGKLILHPHRLSNVQEVRADLEAARAELRESKRQAANLQTNVDQLKARIRELESRVAEVSVRREKPTRTVSKQPLAFEEVPLQKGRATVDVKVALNDVLDAGLTARAEATLNRARSSVEVTPGRLTIPPDGKIQLRMDFNNISSAERSKGAILLRASDWKSHVRVTIPFSIRFARQGDQLADDPDLLNVISWPAGARVFLTELSAPTENRPARREDLGTTPVEVRIPAGLYRVELAAQAGYEGEWAGPAGRSAAVTGGNRRTGLFVSALQKQEHASALVRAIWLPAEGTIVERLSRATAGAPARFAPPEFETFRERYATALAKLGVRANRDEARRLHAFLKKTGYVRYYLADDVAVDFGLLPGHSGTMTVRVVRLGRAARMIPLESESGAQE